jgi:Tfp pilus assembly protein PilF
VKLRGTRDGTEVGFEVPIGTWGLTVRPRFGDDALNVYLEGRVAVASKQLDGGTLLWGAVVKSAEAAGDTDLAIWMNLRLGDTWAEARRWKEAETAYTSAREQSVREANVVAQGVVGDSIGRALQRQNRFQDAEDAYHATKAVRELSEAESLSVARSVSYLGGVAFARGDIETAEAYFMRALELREKLAPESLDLTASLNNLGIVARNRGQLARATDYLSRALAIRERLAPDSLEVAAFLNNLGLVADNRGELSAAEAYHKRALAIKEKLAPDSLDTAYSLNNLGTVAQLRGELAAAEAYIKRALAIREKLAPDGLDVSLPND